MDDGRTARRHEARETYGNRYRAHLTRADGGILPDRRPIYAGSGDSVMARVAVPLDPVEWDKLAGQRVQVADLEERENYVVLTFDDGSTLYASDPTLYRTRA
jgi:hypothetical protein